MATVWAPQPGPQTEAIAVRWCPELFYGGARGGGKSDYLLGDFLQDVPVYRGNWRGILFRRSYPELQHLIKRTHELYPATGAVWNVQDKSWSWPHHGGATLLMRYLERVQDATRYQGHEYTWIGWDELPQWPNLVAYNSMRGCLRSAKPVPHKRIRATGNPGGVGQHEVKAHFIDPSPTGLNVIEGKHGIRMFIPAKIWDNKILLANDPTYLQQLAASGNEALVRAWLHGDWNAVAGAYFHEFSIDQHVLSPFVIPANWTRFMAFDWGSASPFSVGWWAVADGHTALPRGSLIQYREWYGGILGKGLGLDNVEIAKGILNREATGENILFRKADPSIFKEDGGLSIAQQMASAGVVFQKADNVRIPGWSEVRYRLRGHPDNKRPLIYFFNTCPNSIRTLPAVEHDTKHIEDVNSEGDDHAPDMIRYACMSRPLISREVKQAEEIANVKTLDKLWKLEREQKPLFERM